MNSLMKELYDLQPKVNEKTVRGFAMQEVPKAMEYLDKVIVTSMRSANPKFVYKGYRKMLPFEEYSLKANKNSRDVHDLAGSSVVMYELHFEYDGEVIPRKYLYMPFVTDGGIMEISGTKYAITPVLTDTVISPSNNEIFVRLLKTKQFFKNVVRNVVKNDDIIVGEVVYSDTIAALDSEKKNMLGKVVTPAALFIFGKYGFKETFKKYCGTIPVLTTNSEEAYKLSKTHDIYKSTKVKPRTLRNQSYSGHDIHICIPKKENTELAEKLTCALIYAFDILPRAGENIVEATKATIDIELQEWRVLIGRIAYKDHYGQGRCVELIMQKYELLDNYLDIITQEKLEENGVIIEDYYDLLIHIVEKYTHYLIKGKEYTNNVYNRYIEILYYLMFNFIYGVNTMIRDINNMSKSKALTLQNLNKLMTRRLSSKTIFGLVKSGNMNICLTPIDSTTDSMYSKITGILELQERGRGVVKEKNNTFPSNTRKIVGTDLYLGSIYNLPKKYPTPKARLNPYAQFHEVTGRINPPDDLKAKIDYLDTLLSGRVFDDTSAMEIVENEEIDEVKI